MRKLARPVVFEVVDKLGNLRKLDVQQIY